MRWLETMTWKSETSAEEYLVQLHEKLVKPFKAVTIHPHMAWPFEVDYPGWDARINKLAGTFTKQLEGLQQVVGGYIELVPIDAEAGPLQCFDGMVLVVNEEGLLQDLEFNPVATMIVNEGKLPALTEGLGTTIVGSAVLLPKECLRL